MIQTIIERKYITFNCDDLLYQLQISIINSKYTRKYFCLEASNIPKIGISKTSKNSQPKDIYI